jgi:site-specific DNA-adenine methylase
MVTPVTYQGGKTRIAAAIADHIVVGSGPFVDVCCGSGAVSLELRSRGLPVEQIWMVDKGPWGRVWQMIGAGEFNLETFEDYCNRVPSDLTKVAGFMRELSQQSASVDTAYVYLLLQAASFGGKALWIERDRWANTSFRSYWLPTATSSRRSPVNPMMPMPSTILSRLRVVCEAMLGCKGFYCDATDVTIPVDATVYVDPPYDNTTGYGHRLNLKALMARHPCYVSEGRSVGERSVCLSAGRSKGGITGTREVAANAEWLTLP